MCMIAWPRTHFGLCSARMSHVGGQDADGSFSEVNGDSRCNEIRGTAAFQVPGRMPVVKKVATMSYTEICFEITEGVATITLNRPERLNACTATMADEIADALDHLGEARVVVITGAGRAFCSGADLQPKGSDGRSAGDVIYDSLSRHHNTTLLKIARLNVPVITAVNGPAAGMGCSLGLCGDLVIASRSAFFVQAFVNVGLVPDGGATWLLPRLIGRARTMEMMLLGERISAEQAVEWGMIYSCVDDNQFVDETTKLATRLARGPTAAIATIRKNVRAALETTHANALLTEAEAQREAFMTLDANEGRQAFLEKRKPLFQGR
jgi:2-(1,2-epoxy-1,2-dihydrophenyl)acetyl-CoA isomerase